MKEAQLIQTKLVNTQGEKYLTITQGPDYIYAKWRGHITADDVVNAAKAFLEYMKEHPCTKLLNDKSEVTGDWQDANDWLEFDWLPAVYHAGLRCMAHIYSHSMFSQLSARDLRDRVMPPLLMQNFLDFDSAEKWILNCGKHTSDSPA
ncbi:hypothetical protein H8S95_14735 [Pontibacter sp. KCTC 32443]|uniref:hypothetical protein n=1 Tax=Pontibacter TaxID=323449 RepID=UPI00164E5799|nr:MULTISPECIES: hypothetical protein [Pontibacter]MBC5775333.1 hypothetical protein [Pontibacter sp. KCTC 32443]